MGKKSCMRDCYYMVGGVCKVDDWEPCDEPMECAHDIDHSRDYDVEYDDEVGPDDIILLKPIMELCDNPMDNHIYPIGTRCTVMGENPAGLNILQVNEDGHEILAWNNEIARLDGEDIE